MLYDGDGAQSKAKQGLRLDDSRPVSGEMLDVRQTIGQLNDR